MWRSTDWPKCPCDGCDSRVVDEYGYFCDMTCQERTHWLCREEGADAMLKTFLKLIRIEALVPKRVADDIVLYLGEEE